MSGILAFAVIASPAMFRTTRGVFGNWVASQEGLATVPGLLFHGLVFVIVMAIVGAILGRRSNFLTEGGMKFVTRDDQDDENNAHYQQDRFVFSKTV